MSITPSSYTTEAVRRLKRSTNHVLFVNVPPKSSSTSPRKFRAASRVPPLTPHPNVSVPREMFFYPAIFSPSEGRHVDETESEAKHNFHAGDETTSECANARGGPELEMIAGLASIPESTAGFEILNESDGSEFEARVELEKLHFDSNYTQSSDSENDSGTCPLQYQFPLLFTVAPPEASDPAHRISEYPYCSPRTTVNGIFSTAKRAALEHYAENADTFTSPDGSCCPLVYHWMTELIVGKIEAAKSRMLKEIKTVTRKPVYRNDRKDLLQCGGSQPWLCGKMRREAIRAAEEGFKEIDQREGLVSLEGGILINSMTNGNTLSSRPPFSFSYAGTHMTHSSSATFACLCKEGLANRVGSRVLARTMTALASSITLQKSNTLLSSPAQYRKIVHEDYLATLSTLVAEAMCSALEKISRTEDEEDCGTTCGWFDMVHVRPWMVETVWQKARQVAENAEEVLRSGPFTI